MVRATWRLLEFHTPEISVERLKLESSNFVCLQAMSNVSLLIIPDRGVARVTWSILKFYTPLNFSDMAEDRIVKFSALVRPRSIKSCDYKQFPSGRSQSHVTSLFLANKCKYLENDARQRYTYNGRLIGNRIWPIIWQQRQWPWMTLPWMTLKVIHRLQVFSNAIRRTFVQHFTRFQLTMCSRSLCVSWASCMNQKATRMRRVYSRNTESG